MDNVVAIIPGASDYYYPYKNNTKLTSIIPMPVNLGNFSEPTKAEYPVKIFMGVQKGKNYRKGYPFFFRAINKLQMKYDENFIKIDIVESVPFEEYIKLFKNSDIFLDQCLGQGIGVNAALGLANGKAVFSGIVPSFENSSKEIAIDARPSVDDIYNNLVNLIDNLEKLNVLKNNAYNYAFKYNNIEHVVDRYFEVWEK
jgi:hypothetical protein